MSNIEEDNNIKEASDKNLNINLQINNLEEYNFTEENKEINNDFQNIIKNQKSINFMENAPKIEDEINNISSNSNNLYTNNNVEEEEENNNIINNGLEDENDDMNLEQESINKTNNENDDEELPLITLNFISVCQCCKKTFDDREYKPYLLKCGHFFCVKCIKEYFTDKSGIKCPSDGLIAKSLDELTLLNNLIPKKKEKNETIKTNNLKNDNQINFNENEKDILNINNNETDTDVIVDNNYNQNYCQIHKGQKLSHIICDSNEIICVYCAFESFKKNPKREIKELSTQLSDFSDNINKIIASNQNEVLNLHNALKKIKLNKETEEKSINTFFECLIDYIKEKQSEFIDKVNEIFNTNTKKLGDKLEEVTENIEKSEKIKNLIEAFFDKEEKNENNVKENYNEILSKYLLFQQKMKISKQNLFLDEYKFKHIDEEQIAKNCQNLGDIILLNKKNFNIDIIDKNSVRENYNKELNRVNIKKIIFGENKTEKDFDGFDNNKGKLSKMKNDKSFDNIYNRNKNPIFNEKKNKSNYIILDDLSLNKNNNSLLNNNKNFQNMDMNNEEEIVINNLGENKTINDEKIKRNKFDFKIKRKSTYTINRNKNRNLLYKSGKNQYNYINFPNYNTNLNNYCLWNKIGKKDKEKNTITVNNYEVHQTLKNSFNNNYNYGHNYNNSNYINKINDFNNFLFNGYNTTTNKTQTNRNKLTLLNKKFNKIIKFK
jgi:hypothetical protein